MSRALHRSLRRALLVALANQTILVALGRYRLSYDAYVHMFFADHYRQAWWSLWEPRWYAGFSVVSYPPLVHQLIGLLSLAVGVELAWVVVFLAVLVALPLGIQAFARLFVGPAAAGRAAWLGAVLPSIYLAAHTFGQLPTLTGLLFSLLGLAALGAFLQRGRWRDGLAAVAWVAAAAAAHHGTLLFLPFGAAAVAGRVLRGSRPRAGRSRQSPGSVAGCLLPYLRLGIFALAAADAVLFVIWPFWVWGLGQQMQTPIDHLSRHNFLRDPAAPLMFFWPEYGPLIVFIPLVLWMFRFRRRFLALGVTFTLVFILGLGGTTPLPRWLFGANWEWLTCDRFALWASVLLLPFVGAWAVARAARPVWGAVLIAAEIVALIPPFLTSILPTQPSPLDLQPIATFLAESDRSQWRYLTFGFGDQLAYLSRLTPATTIDGSYHTARELPELRLSGLGQIDAAYWLPGGLGKLEVIFDSFGRYGVRWGFVNLAAYEPLLIRHGWQRLATLSNGVTVWENPRAMYPSAEDLAARADPLAAAAWGTFPLAALVTALALEMSRRA